MRWMACTHPLLSIALMLTFDIKTMHVCVGAKRKQRPTVANILTSDQRHGLRENRPVFYLNFDACMKIKTSSFHRGWR